MGFLGKKEYIRTMGYRSQQEDYFLEKMRREIEEEEDGRAIELLNKAAEDLKVNQVTKEEGKERFMVNFSFEAEDAEEAEYFVKSIINWVNAIPSLESPLKLEKLVAFKDVIGEIASFDSDQIFSKNGRLDQDLNKNIYNRSFDKKSKELYNNYFNKFDSLADKGKEELYADHLYDHVDLASEPETVFVVNDVQFTIGSVIEYKKFDSNRVESGKVMNVTQIGDSLGNIRINVVNTVNGSYQIIDTSKTDVVVSSVTEVK